MLSSFSCSRLSVSLSVSQNRLTHAQVLCTEKDKTAWHIKSCLLSPSVFLYLTRREQRRDTNTLTERQTTKTQTNLQTTRLSGNMTKHSSDRQTVNDRQRLTTEDTQMTQQQTCRKTTRVRETKGEKRERQRDEIQAQTKLEDICASACVCFTLRRSTSSKHAFILICTCLYCKLRNCI